MKHKKPLPLMIAAALLAFPATQALAQDDDSAGVLEEVIVTATKRESSLQDTAISVAAYQGELLEELQIEDVQSLILQDPSMSFSRAGGEGQVFIRGVGSNLLGIGQDSSVAIHQDGVYLGRPHLALSQFLDVDRVEVLRGPQGTLYGRNATAGVVNVISRKPTDEAEGHVSGYYGNFGRVEVEAGFGGPVSDSMGFRVAGRWSEDDGFTDDLDPRGGDTIDDRDNYAVRGILDFHPSDDFSAELIADYSESNSHNLSVQRLDNRHTSQRLGALPNADFDQTRNELDTFQDWEVTGLTLTMDWNLGNDLSLVSITGYRDFEDNFSFNTDGVELSVTNTQYQRDSEQLTQEIRLGTSGNNRFDWLVGFFYMNEDKSEALGLPAINFGGSFNIFAENETDALAVFSEVYFNISDTMRLIGGLRWNDEEKDDFSKRGLVFFNDDKNFDTGVIGLADPDAMNFDFPFGSRTTKDSWDDWTPKLGLEWRPDDDLLVYGTITKGFKSGGTNSLDTSPPFDQEELWSYEVGFKSTLDDGAIVFNGAAFYYDYDDLQVSTFANGTTRIENAASARLLGLELNLGAVLGEGLTGNIGITLLDTEYDDFITTFGVQADGSPNVVDLSGNSLINAPDIKFVGNLRYEWDMGGNGAYVLGQLSHQDRVYHSQFNEDIIGQGSLTLLDLRAAYLFGDDEEWELAALVKNATDEEYYQNSVRFTSLSDTTTDPQRIGAALGYPAEGRSYGIQVRYRF